MSLINFFLSVKPMVVYRVFMSWPRAFHVYIYIYIYIASLYFYEKDIKNKHKSIITIFIMKFPKKHLET